MVFSALFERLALTVLFYVLLKWRTPTILCSLLPLIKDYTRIIYTSTVKLPKFPSPAYKCVGFDNCDLRDINVTICCSENEVYYIKKINQILVDQEQAILSAVGKVNYINNIGNPLVSIELPKEYGTTKEMFISMTALETWESYISTTLLSLFVLGFFFV